MYLAIAYRFKFTSLGLCPGENTSCNLSLWIGVWIGGTHSGLIFDQIGLAAKFPVFLAHLRYAMQLVLPFLTRLP